MQDKLHYYKAKLVRVIDADTLVFDVDQGLHEWHHGLKVRLFGVNAPEMNTEAGQAARAYVVNWLNDHPQVIIKTIQDKEGVDKSDSFGRYLAIVYTYQGVSLADELLRDRHAIPYRS